MNFEFDEYSDKIWIIMIWYI